MSNAPKVRGAFLTALNRPVLVRPSDAEATIVLDECHHLKAHWAIVVHYLVRRLKRAGLSPTLIGLTATEPSGEDRSARRYRALLGDVDAEVPVPAVIRAGHLAPCRQLAWFTLPSPEETTFLTTAGEELHHRVGELLLSPDGIDYLLEVVAPPMSSTAPGDGSGSGPLPRTGGPDDDHAPTTSKPLEEDELVRRIRRRPATGRVRSRAAAQKRRLPGHGSEHPSHPAPAQARPTRS